MNEEKIEEEKFDIEVFKRRLQIQLLLEGKVYAKTSRPLESS
jgi:hypothetical protein